MNLFNKLKKTNWLIIVLFYVFACALSFIFLKFPNFLKEISVIVFKFNIPFNWNHGIALLLASIIGYKIVKLQHKTSFFGNNSNKTILFAVLFLSIYSLFGINNKYNINPHLWAFIFCLVTLIYDIFEETVWRGFINDNLTYLPFWLKGIITGVFWGAWHLIVFENFDQFGGIFIFILMCIILSIIIAYATDKTNSILFAATIHALFCKTNYATLICVVLLIVLILSWKIKTNNIEQINHSRNKRAIR